MTTDEERQQQRERQRVSRAKRKAAAVQRAEGGAQRQYPWPCGSCEHPFRTEGGRAIHRRNVHGATFDESWRDDWTENTDA